MQTKSFDILCSAELPPAQAQAILKVMEIEFDTSRAELATHGDIADAKADLRVEMQRMRADLAGEIQTVRADLRGEIQSVRAELVGAIQNVRADLTAAFHREVTSLTRWMVGSFMTQVATLLTLVYSLFELVKR